MIAPRISVAYELDELVQLCLENASRCGAFPPGSVLKATPMMDDSASGLIAVVVALNTEEPK